ncbi:MAG: hypothetical protein COB67_03340 [SAR324 cluster bacterium]|uniref:AB hydrolase-1 domain-containing protein n=1 Tax=SAR324 cluster bacterium TaxID=2024889 RepID=A0A2A4T8A6_9DELT|nr:MAG: hypothetical protein COB67_03340 [SAR324 cluster bacterium]
MTEIFTAVHLLNQMGRTPVDNTAGHTSALHWKSKLGAVNLRYLIHLSQALEAMEHHPLFFGPVSAWAGWQKRGVNGFWLDPIKQMANQAIEEEESPDIFIRGNQLIEKQYTGLLYEFCSHFITDNHFNQVKIKKIRVSTAGQKLIYSFLTRFSRLEKSYHTLGLSKLKAIKELLKSLLILITETPLLPGNLPFSKTQVVLEKADFKEYLGGLRSRLEVLYAERAFDPMTYSEVVTQHSIGCTAHQIVPHSNLKNACLLHFTLPDQIQPNGDAIYLSSPMINHCEIFDLAPGKSLVELLVREGYQVYLVKYSNPGREEVELGLGFYGKELHDHFLEIITELEPQATINIFGYCMGGTLILPYLARRAEERLAQGKEMDIKKLILMTSPVSFDDSNDSFRCMRAFINGCYDPLVIDELFGETNIPSQVIDAGMEEAQPGVQYTTNLGFFSRAFDRQTLRESAPFVYWLTHGIRFPIQAHREWIQSIYLDNQIFNGTYCLPSGVPQLHDKPVDMKALEDADITILDYRGTRDTIAPPSTCIASELWGKRLKNRSITQNGLNRTIEKNVGHGFVVNPVLLKDFVGVAIDFLQENGVGE